MTWLLMNWKLAIGGGLLAALGVMFLLLQTAQAKAARVDDLIADLEAQEAQSVALANRYVQESKARFEAEERERILVKTRTEQQREARNQYERISGEILQALGADECAVVGVPAGAVDSLRDFATYANGISGNPGRSIRSDTFRIE